MKKSVQIYTDGACSGNPGAGGWGAILVYGDKEKELFGGEDDTTNNRMELMAAIEGLRALKGPCKVDLYTDSTYVKDGITKWVEGWQVRGWKTAAKKPVKNVDLWQILLEVSRPHEICWHWVRGHSGHDYNERADEIARAAIIK